MGTRLYPRTENPTVLEKLACVPTGTMRRLRSAKAQLIATRKGVRYYLVAGKSELVAVRNRLMMSSLSAWSYHARRQRRRLPIACVALGPVHSFQFGDWHDGWCREDVGCAVYDDCVIPQVCMPLANPHKTEQRTDVLWVVQITRVAHPVASLVLVAYRHEKV